MACRKIAALDKIPFASQIGQIDAMMSGKASGRNQLTGLVHVRTLFTDVVLGRFRR